jgi:phenylalanyl-tRNA synthetase beta chain
MKLSESWLREWVNPPIDCAALCEQLTMAGLEIESVQAAAAEFSQVVVGHIISVVKHTDSDRLHVCEVDIGTTNTVSIVCGANNVKPNMKVPVALVNAKLPNNIHITLSKIRGIASYGMLCSARELGLAEESEGLLVLPQYAPLGKDLREYLQLSDTILELSITPNRGDCLSIRGLAKEVSALTGSTVVAPTWQQAKATLAASLPIQIQAKAECPRYVGRVIREVKAHVATPIWLREKLRRSGLRSINPIVDVMNYVMLELGQPMHAFDLSKIAGGVIVRVAKDDEKITLLDNSEATLTAGTLIIADNNKPLAIAGVMGGLDSAVTLQTQDIFLESAFFHAATIASATRQYHVHSDSSYRFERGIDPTIQAMAIERATQLILQIVGGQAGPLIEVTCQDHLPKTASIMLGSARLAKIIGCDIPAATIEKILLGLDFTFDKQNSGWLVTIPTRRSDVRIEEDLIEEVARIYGYNHIPTSYPIAELKVIPCPEHKITAKALRHALCDLGYQEVVTYSFVDKKIQQLFSPEQIALPLLNPITAEMDVMRTSLWPGLVNTLIYNQNRQQSRIRLFEMGLRFIVKDKDLLQQNMLSGLISGTHLPEQWGVVAKQVDFYDMKGDLENLFKLTLHTQQFNFKPGKNPALHPGQTADIYRSNQKIGVIGALHPHLLQELKIDGKVFLFELEMEKLELARLPRYDPLSKYPEIRRDIALLLDQAIPSEDIRCTIKEVAGDLLQKVNIFDVYQGKGITPGFKSIALALTLQHASRTLVDDEVATLMERVVNTLKERFNAELRG